MSRTRNKKRYYPFPFPFYLGPKKRRRKKNARRAIKFTRKCRIIRENYYRYLNMVRKFV